MGGWQERAACREEDPELFFPLGQGQASAPQIEDAKFICGLCTERDACLDFALRTGSLGIWGGTDDEDRRKLRRRLSRQRANA